MAKEKLFENKLKSFLRTSHAWYIKYWAGAQFTKEGIPDILACINGYFFGIEVKANTGKPTLIQLVNLRKIREAGGYGILLYPDNFDGFISFVKTHNSIWYNENIQMQNLWFDKLNK